MTTSTFDNSPPTRPVNADMVSVSLSDATKAPDPNTHPNAEGWNMRGIIAAAVGKVCPLAILDVRFSAGTPSIFAVLSPGSTPVPGSFTVVDNGNGDTTIWWASTLLPGVVQPMVSQTDDTEIDRIRAINTTVSSAPAVHVKTKLAGVGTDANFVVALY